MASPYSLKMNNNTLRHVESGDQRRGIVFAMRYADSVGFVWSTIAANRDLIAEHLSDDLECYVAYPKLSGDPSYIPRRLQPVELDCYDTSDAGLMKLQTFLQRKSVCAIVFMSALPSKLNMLMFKRLGVLTVNTENDSFDRLSDNPFVTISKFLIRRVLKLQLHDLHIANADSQGDWLKRNAKIPSRRLVVINDGIDCQRFVPPIGGVSINEPLGMDTQHQWVICVSQSRVEKRVDAVIRLARSVIDARPNSSIAFIYVGDGPCLNEWQELAGKLGLTKQFVFAGAQKNLVPFFQASRLMVHTSERESFGLVVAEAMSCGLPVVAYGAAGPKEIIVDGTTGKVVEIGDEPALLAATLEYLDSPAMAQQHGKAGRLRVLQRFSGAEQAKLMAKHIRCLCGVQRKATLIFAMRYPDDVGFVWNTIARTRDLVAAQLDEIAECFIAYPRLTESPSYQPQNMRRIELDCYDASTAGTRRLESYLHNNRVDAIVYMSALPSSLNMRMLKRLGVQTINTENYSYDHSKRDSVLGRVAKMLVRRFMKLQLHNLHIANSQSQGAWLQNYAQIPTERMLVVPNGVDVEHYVPGNREIAASKLGLSLDRHWIVCSFQAREEKRLDFIVKAAHRIACERPDLKLGFIHVGDGPCMISGRRLADELKLGDYFVFAGHQRDLLPYYQLAHLFVHAATRESFGLVIAEAMACELPIVACAATGPAELVRHGITGYLVGIEDAIGFSNAICNYFDHPELMSQHGKMGRLRVKENFLNKIQTQKMAKAIGDLLVSN